MFLNFISCFFVSTLDGGFGRLVSCIACHRPAPLILDEEGRTIDAKTGQTIQLQQYMPTLKVGAGKIKYKFANIWVFFYLSGIYFQFFPCSDMIA